MLPEHRKLTRAEQREALKLLIRFAWGHGSLDEFTRARQLVIDVLELSDERPLDRQRRKSALNNFLADGIV